jgi:M6 family metalloprotease-like protein
VASRLIDQIKNRWNLDNGHYTHLRAAVFIAVFALVGTTILLASHANPSIDELSCGTTQPDLSLSKPNSSQIETDKAEIAQTNQSVKDAVKVSSKKPNAKLKERIKDRKQRLIKLAYADPQAAAKQVLAQPVTNKVESTTNCFEKAVTLKGTLEIREADSLNENTGSSEITLLHVDNQAPLVLHYEPTQVLQSGTTVQVTGSQLDQEVIAALSSDNSPVVNVVTPPPNVPTTGQKRVAVIMVYFQDSSVPTLTKPQMNDLLFNQTNKYYQENSYQKLSFTGDVFGWYLVPSKSLCDLNQVFDAALTAANADANYTNYTNIMILAAFPSTCSHGGVGTLGGTTVTTPDGVLKNIGITWIGLINPPNFSHNYTLFAHELGHNLGLSHANLLTCDGVSLTASLDNGTCPYLEYGDFYDDMGISDMHFNGTHKDYLGWFNPGNTKVITSSGTYTIEPLATNTNNLKVLKIPRGNSNYLYVEYRQPIGFDANKTPSTKFIYGGMVHIGSSKSWLIDPTLPIEKDSATLRIGDSITDPATGTKITATGSTATTFTVTVTIPSGTDTTKPTAPTNLTATATSSSQINLSWTPATDNVGVTGYDVYRGGTKIASNTTSTTWGENGLTANTTFSYYVVAKDGAGNQSSNSNTASATTLKVATTGNISGYVGNGAGSGIANVTIHYNLVGSTVMHTATSGTSGFYRLVGLKAGTYKLTFAKTGYVTKSIQKTVVAGQTVNQNVSLVKK